MTPWLFMAQTFGDTDPRPFGFDAAIEFPPHKLTTDVRPVNEQLEMLDFEFSGTVFQYDEVVSKSLGDRPSAFPLIKTAIPSWDNDARRQGAGIVVQGSTPAKFEAWLNELIARAVSGPCLGESFICINAWNEWAEGAYLEPDLHFGAAYLNATARAVTGLSQDHRSPTASKLLLVGHDAFPAGAQHLLLYIGRALKRRFGMVVEYLLLGGGGLEDAYRAAACTTIVASPEDLRRAAAAYRAKGFIAAIVNSAASGRAVTALTAAGLDCTHLVHELPLILTEKHLTEDARAGFDAARTVIFPAAAVRDALVASIGAPAGRVLVHAQGCYRPVETSDQAALQFRREQGIAVDEAVVLGMGYADLRKGFDLFLQLWRLLNTIPAVRIHVCWLGKIDPGVALWLARDIDQAAKAGTFHMVGHVADVVPALSAGSVLALTSREDPFPAVVLEAAAAGLPVVAFAGSGGVPEVIEQHRLGRVLPHADVAAMAAAIRDLIAAGNPPEAQAARRQVIAAHFSFDGYVSLLRDIALPQLPKISVAVFSDASTPHLAELLASVVRQTHPVFELIVVSLDPPSHPIVDQVAQDWDRDIRVLAQDGGPLSPLARCRKAAEATRGDWLWIAGARDAPPHFLADLMNTAEPDAPVVMAVSASAGADEGLGGIIWKRLALLRALDGGDDEACLMSGDSLRDVLVRLLDGREPHHHGFTAPAAPAPLQDRQVILAQDARQAAGRGDHDGAARLAEDLRRQCPDSPAGYQIGLAAAREMRRFDEATRLFAESAARFPAAAWPISETAWTAIRRGDRLEATRLAGELRRHFPNEPEHYFIESYLLRQQGRMEEAETLLRQASHGVPEPVHAQDALAALMRLRAHWAKGSRLAATLRGMKGAVPPDAAPPCEPRAAKGPTVTVVLGMHRAGTSLCARIIERLGVALGSPLVAAGLDNPDGFQEHAAIVACHETLLGALDASTETSWLVQPPAPAFWREPLVRQERDRLRDIVIAQTTAADGRWGFKDPRTVRFLPLWVGIFEELGITPIWILAVRDPHAVAASLHARNGTPPDIGELLWQEHYMDALRHLGPAIAGIVHYEAWFDAPEAQTRALAAMMGVHSQDRIAAAMRAIRPELRHDHPAPDDALRGLVATLYGGLSAKRPNLAALKSLAEGAWRGD